MTESDNGYNGTEAVKLTFNGKTSVLRVKNNEINALKTFDTVTVEFRLKYDGTGYNNTLRVYKAESDLVDYGYPANVWNRVRFKTMVYTENGENFVKIELDFAANKTAYISDLKVTASEEDKPLLGGVKLISLESITLAMGYVVITPDNKVIVIDGGYVDGVIASRWLPNVNKHGGIIFECDPSQTLEIADMLMPYAMRVKIVTDIFGLQRAVYADTF